MARIPLLGGAYEARSIIASAQKSINLYAENNPASCSPPAQVTQYLTPGLTLSATAPGGSAPLRGLYRDTKNNVYAVAGNNVYGLTAPGVLTLIGVMTNAPGFTTTPISMCDNGITVCLVDGSANGYTWDLGGAAFAQITDAAFYGSRQICYLDGFFIFAAPGTNSFYLSPYYWNGTDPFDPTYVAEKTGGPDPINGITVVNGEIWLVGELTSEIWYDAGGQDFPFARQPGIFIEHGMVIGWTICQCDVAAFWLGRDRQGQAVVFKGAGYQAIRISNNAIENLISAASEYEDAIGFTYQQDGHTFYFLTFPGGDITYVYDLSTDQWHQRTWTDPSGGAQHRHRAMCFTFVDNACLVGDWQNGNMYVLDLASYTDNGNPITRLRSFPHIVNDGKRVSYPSFIADLDTSHAIGTINFVWSDNRGQSYGTPLSLTIAADASQSLIWRQLGIARDRVFELSWTFPYFTALNGAWVETEQAET